MIRLENVSKNYGALWAVRDLSLTVERGEIIGLVGPNGAGKSTTMKMITGYLVPTEGRIEVDGIPVPERPTEAQARIGYLPESNPIYPEMSVQDYLVFMGRMRGVSGIRLEERLFSCVESCGLRDRLTTSIRTLSKGYKQRVGIAQAMIHDPDILILDEPTSGLDPNQIAEIRRLIRELGRDKTVILSTHILSEVEETCSRAVMIVGGRVAVDDRISNLSGAGSTRITLLEAEGDPAAAIRSLAAVATVEPVEAPSGSRSYRVAPKSGSELGSALYELAVSRKWKVSEIARERRSLADVFREASAPRESADANGAES